MSDVFVIISATDLLDRIRVTLDKGFIKEANDLYFQSQALVEKMQSYLGEKRLKAFSYIPDCIMFECDEGNFDEILAIYDGFKSSVGGLIACGVGLTVDEARMAVRRSKASHDIELYDPETMKKGELELPVNLTDPKVHEFHDITKPKKEDKFVASPDADKQMQAEAQLVQMVGQQMAPPPQPQQQQQAQPQQQQQQAQPRRSLLDALTGKQGEAQPEEKEEVEKDESSIGEPKEKHNLDKVGESLLQIKEQIPQLMDLAERNPEAYKQAVGLISKMLALAKQKVQKTEDVDEMEELVKAFNAHSKRIVAPVGTVRHRKKKVMVDGKAVWRSVISGMVKDQKGQAISVKSHNAKSDSKDDIDAG